VHFSQEVTPPFPNQSLISASALSTVSDPWIMLRKTERAMGKNGQIAHEEEMQNKDS
jgi:hypothetical protein